MKKRFDKDILIPIGFIALIFIMIFAFNIYITGQPIAESVPGSETYGTYCETSNQYSAEYSCSKAIDGNINSDWAINFNVKADGNPTKAWIKLNLDKKTTINKIILKSRMCKGCGNIKKGNLIFSDGSKIENIEVPYGRAVPQGKEIVFTAPKTVSWIKLEIIQTWGPNAGLSELEIYDSSGKITILKPTPCTDTDPTNDLYKEGYVIYKGEKYDDKCITYSRHHKKSGSPTIKSWGCEECKREAVGSFWKVSSSGYPGIKAKIRSAPGEYEYTCQVRQYYCENNELKSDVKWCNGGCKNGKCLPLKIAIVEFIPDNLNVKLYDFSGQTYDTFTIFNNKNEIMFKVSGSEVKIYSFYKILDWFEREFKSYNLKIPIELTTLGPYKTNVLPPQGEIYNFEFKGFGSPSEAIKSLRKQYKKYREIEKAYENYFVSESKKNNIDLSQYDLIAYTYFSNKPIFRSFAAELSIKSVYINPVIDTASLSNFNYYNIDALFTVIHELLHRLGTNDYYNEGEASCLSGGYVEPNKKPFYPQYQSCVMCSIYPLINERTITTISDLIDLKLCDAAAREIGWSGATSVRCYDDRDCGPSSFEYDFGGVIYKDTIKCNNPGTTNSYCSYTPIKR